MDGDWVAARYRLWAKLEQITIFINEEECLNAGNGGLHPTPCQADHIGPIFTRSSPTISTTFVNHV